MKLFEKYLNAIKRSINIKLEVKNYQLDDLILRKIGKDYKVFNLITFITKLLPYSSASNDPPKVGIKFYWYL